MDTDRWWYALHMLGIILFLGNILVTFLWKVLADATKNIEVIHFAQRLVAITDKSFTLLGAVILSIGGYGYAHAIGLDLLNTPWLLWGQICFFLSGFVWGVFLVPVQKAQMNLLSSTNNLVDIEADYRRLSIRWYWIGTMATLPVVLAVLVMSLK